MIQAAEVGPLAPCAGSDANSSEISVASWEFLQRLLRTRGKFSRYARGTHRGTQEKQHMRPYLPGRWCLIAGQAPED